MQGVTVRAGWRSRLCPRVMPAGLQVNYRGSWVCACVCFGIDRAFHACVLGLIGHSNRHTRCTRSCTRADCILAGCCKPKVQHISRIEREAVSAAALQRAWACKQRTLFPKCVCVCFRVRARAGAGAYVRVNTLSRRCDFLDSVVDERPYEPVVLHQPECVCVRERERERDYI